MDNLVIEATKNTPSINFAANGKLILSGNAYSENARDFFEPIIQWSEKLESNEINFDMMIDYINTSSSTKLLELLKILEENTHISSLKVNWFYEEGDVDHLEAGEILEESLKRTHFQFIEYERKLDLI